MDITNKKNIFDYDVNIFNFSELFVKHLSSFNIDNLQNLHSHLPKTLLPKEVVNVENDQSMPIYKILYKIDKGYDLNNSDQSGIFLNTYKEFVHHLSSTIFKEKLIYQRKPTLRIHLPENKSVGGFHRDRDYNHPIEEINIFTPNSDGNNDFFIPINIEQYENITLKVFNRWGKIVYEQINYNNDWDGTHYKSGKELKEGVYLYIIETNSEKYEYEDSEKEELKTTLSGYVHLIR